MCIFAFLTAKFILNLEIVFSVFLFSKNDLLLLRKTCNMIGRLIKDSILADYRRKKVIVLLGARQVGKTTLLSALWNGAEKKCFL